MLRFTTAGSVDDGKSTLIGRLLYDSRSVYDDQLESVTKASIGRNAGGYALKQRVGPVPTVMDNFARAKLIVRTTLLHARETAAITPGAPAVELELA